MCLKILLNPNFLTYGNIIVLIIYTEKTYKPPGPKDNISMYRQLWYVFVFFDQYYKN